MSATSNFCDAIGPSSWCEYQINYYQQKLRSLDPEKSFGYQVHFGQSTRYICDLCCQANC